MFRIGTLFLIVWFAIGAAAAWQRDYFKSGSDTCAHGGTVAATVAAGPLNYVGVNPKIHNCHVPQPSS